MAQSPAQVSQSFLLRFWREPRRSAQEQWRGTVWHERQNPTQGAIPVDGVEAAFDIVRAALNLATDGSPAPPETHDPPPAEG